MINRNEIDDDDDYIMIGDRKIRRTHKKGEIAKDGEVIRVPMFMMDAAMIAQGETTQRAIADAAGPQLHRPGFVGVSDALTDAKELLRDYRKERLSNAWREPPPLDLAAFSDTAPAKPPVQGNDAQDPYAKRDARLRDAWKAGAA